MDFSKLKNKLLIILCLLVVFLPFYLITPVLADSEEVEVTVVDNISINPNGNYFISNGSTGYFQLEKGYIYTIYVPDTISNCRIATSDSVPVLNGTYNYLTTIGSSTGVFEYSYISNTDNILYLDYSWAISTISVTREKITGMDSTVEELASVVSPSAMWDVFDISVNYIVIVVLVALGLFIIFRLIKKVSKGKEGF